MSEQLVADLKTTRSILAERGRCDGWAHPDGRVCLDHAIALATSDYGVIEDYIYLQRDNRAANVIDALLQQLPEENKQRAHREGFLPYQALYMFNDEPRTTDEMIFNLIDKALADCGGLG